MSGLHIDKTILGELVLSSLKVKKGRGIFYLCFLGEQGCNSLNKVLQMSFFRHLVYEGR